MYIARYSYFTANIAQVEKENKYMLLISELKSNDCLKVDGRKVDVLLLGLRNDYHLHHFFCLFNSKIFCIGLFGLGCVCQIVWQI